MSVEQETRTWRAAVAAIHQAGEWTERPVVMVFDTANGGWCWVEPGYLDQPGGFTLHLQNEQPERIGGHFMQALDGLAVELWQWDPEADPEPGKAVLWWEKMLAERGTTPAAERARLRAELKESGLIA